MKPFTSFSTSLCCPDIRLSSNSLKMNHKSDDHMKNYQMTLFVPQRFPLQARKVELRRLPVFVTQKGFQGRRLSLKNNQFFAVVNKPKKKLSLTGGYL